MPAPIITAALSSIAPALARQGLDLLSGVFRGALNKGSQEIATLIEDKTGIDINDVADDKLSQEQWSKLKEFEFLHQAKLLETRQQSDANELERERLHLSDRADARDLQKSALASDDKLAKRFIYYYASGITLFTFVFIFFASFYDTANQNKGVVDTVLGFLLGVTLSAIIQYFYGSSSGSKSKEEKMREMVNTAQLEKNKNNSGGVQ